jgi:Zn-dependent peptidase ImmA (M78 family)
VIRYGRRRSDDARAGLSVERLNLGEDASVGALAEAPVTPAVIAWALEEDGRPLREIADRLHVETDDIRAWVDGRSRPSRGQVTELAETLDRPRALFFLPRAPQEAALPTSFRHPADDDRGIVSAAARRWIRRARRSQRFAAWLREEQGSRPIHLPLVRSPTDPRPVATKTRQWLELTNDDQLSWRDQSFALGRWRRAIEETGIFVFQFEIGEGDIRGFSAWDELAPMIALNASSMTPAARIFTLGHELGHLVSRTDAACLDWVAPRLPGGQSIERWCDRYSAALLLPNDLVSQVLAPAPSRDDLTLVRTLASKAKVSLRAAALRLVDLGTVDWSAYRRVEAVAPPRRASRGGGSVRRPVKRLREYGPYLPTLVDDAVQSGRMSPRDAYDLLRVHVEDYRQLTNLAREQLARD